MDSASISGKVRVRFAPSPTGQVHVGNARTALVNWLFARQQGGAFILRIEDTDLDRSEARYETQLIEDIKWLGLDWDEGPDIGGPYPPYRQSDKWQTYRDYAERLVGEGKAYRCFCTQEVLERQREQALAQHLQPNYPGTCRNLAPEEAERRRAAGEPCAIRLKIPEKPIRFHDIVRGWVEFSNEVVSDLIILRSTGVPVYNYVVVIDDAEMKITHVIRGDDHLSNTPKQVALYEALGWPVPEFAHLSTILGPDKERLSKRHGATSLANFREMGVLPEALMNYMALLGWAPTGGDREIFSANELVQEFDLARVTPSPAVFDFEKLYWINRHYIKIGEPQRIASLAEPFYQRALGIDELTPEIKTWLAHVTASLAHSVNKLDELPERAAPVLRFDPVAAVAIPENAAILHAETTPKVLDVFAAKLAAEPEPIAADRFKALVKEVQKETGVKGPALFHPIRILLTGAQSGPEFDKIVPLMEEGSKLALPRPIPSVKQRFEAFRKLQ
ncbi:MAG TPA: glutamate--tRNA ligase [Candidatus Saccharimonadales bacterium]|nr:glutamate--tRNA ligase [Candidatus Saccharimonadales bacterium]